MKYPTDPATAFRQADTEVLAAYDNLRAVWKELSSVDVYICLAPKDCEFLKELIIKRIQPVNAFEFLAKTDVAGAIEILLRRYLGIG